MPNTRFNPQQALVCAMVLMAASDRNMTDAEVGMMSRLVQELPVFSDFHPAGIASVTETCLGLLEREDGLDRAMALIRDALPQRLRETAYLLACEVAAADGEACPGRAAIPAGSAHRPRPRPADRRRDRAGGEGALPGDLSGPPQPASSALP